MRVHAAASDVTQEDRLRADLYGFLSSILAAPPDKASLEKTAAMEGDDTELGRAFATLATLAGKIGPGEVEREFNRLFIGIGRGELVPYASYYMTGFLNEKPLAALRSDMARLGVERAPDVFEPEDNIASLCEIMAGLITGGFGAPVSVGAQRDFFNKHIAPWAGHFFADLERAKSSVFYAPLGTIGRVFMGIERDAFRMAGETAA